MKSELKLTYKEGFKKRFVHDMKQNGSLYLLILPVLAFFVIFCYAPMYGAIIAFQDFAPARGIMGSRWVGFSHFRDFFTNYYFWRLLRNTLVISFSNLLVTFPASIIFALLLNEIRSKYFAKTIQTVTYMPHFISLVVLCGLVKNFTAADGIINDLIAFFGGERVTMLNEPKYFTPLYVLSSLWQDMGWGSIIYLGALAGVDQQLYEAAYLDGAGRLKQTFYVTLPGIMPTIVIMLIMAIGGTLNIGYEKIILLYSPVTYETGDIIASFVYRKGLQDAQYSYATAVGLFNSVVSFGLVIIANTISNKYQNVSLW